MAPFIPQGIINPELNLFFALMLGIGFGYILESAGFSSSRRLAGVFYGYDFVVLRVFFTAGVTAMTGLLFFSYLGWVDMSLVYINPLFLWSAIFGGVIMGFGFILGGYCPGTSLVAAVIGKIDAMLFILGAMIGIFIFGHFYDAFEPIYTGNFLGNVFIYDTLGISRDWFALILTLVALMAFAITQMIEDRVNSVSSEIQNQRPSYKTPAMLLISLIFIFLLIPDERSSSFRETGPNTLHAELLSKDRFVDAQKVTYHIMQEEKGLILVDVRTPDDYRRFSLPGAVNIPMEEVTDRAYRRFFRENREQLVFYGFGDSAAELAWTAARRAGYENIYVLDGGLNKLFDWLFNSSEKPKDKLDMMEEFENRFVKQAREFFLEGKALKEEPRRPVPVIQTIELETPGGTGGC